MAPSQAAYQRLAQDEEVPPTTHSRSSTTSSHSRQRRLSRPELPKIDLHDIQDKFKAWIDRIKTKKNADVQKQEIAFSVFEPAFPRTAYPAVPLKTLDHEPPMTKEAFDKTVDAVKIAILDGIHPKMIAKGSSGSYFARVKEGDRQKIVGVFKPKDEEPYGRLNPKTTKWLHRQFRWIIPFGRSCLIPNLSYISEAAASLMDTRLELNIVPRTELISLSSSSFFYDWIDRVAAKNGKPLPDKIGSLQYFLHGYTDASIFLREHPWPGRSITDTFDDENHRTGFATKKVIAGLNVMCGKTGAEEDFEDEVVDDEQMRGLYDNPESTDFYWSTGLQQDFRLELEKLIILDYIIRNTDRGADNYMIKYCTANHDRTIVNQAPTRNASPIYPSMGVPGHNRQNSSMSTPAGKATPLLVPANEPLTPTSNEKVYSKPHMHIAAIDNSLSFPHEHPKGWRSFTYGWLYLPVSLIGRPFSEQTRRHFLPLLSSKTWWEETTYELKKLFSVDPDFHPKMFARQMAVLKGQAWNVLQSLKHPDEGPLELTRRVKVLVWDNEIEVGETFNAEAIVGPMSASATLGSMNPFTRGSPTRPRRLRSASTPRADAKFPPPTLTRSSSDLTGAFRPVPFSSKVTRVNPGATGVSVLEHLERLDRVEEGLHRLGPANSEDILFEDPEGEEQALSEDQPLIKAPQPKSSKSSPKGVSSQAQPRNSTGNADTTTATATASTSAPLVRNSESNAGSNSNTKSRISGLGKPSSRMSEDGPRSAHIRWASTGEGRSGRSMDVPRGPLSDDDGEKRLVIAERLETVEVKAFFSCW